MISRLALSHFCALLAILSVSPLFSFFVPGNLLFLVSLFAVILINFRTISWNPALLAVLGSLFMVAALLSLYWQDFKLLFYPIYFVTAAIAVYSLPTATRISFIKVASYLMLAICAGAVVGFVYALIGGEPLFVFGNSDGRPNYFYLTSLTNVVIGRVIRPSGIFDEPGTLSFFICFVAAGRHMYGMPKKTTWALLVTGLITLSLAHLVYMVCHLMSERLFSKKFLLWGGGALCVLVALSFQPDVAELLDNAFLSRFAVVDGQLAGDNRSALLMNAYAHLDMTAFAVGLDSTCLTDYTACREQYGMLGENVLGPLVQGGVFLSMPYYLILIWLGINGLRNRSHLVLLGLALLLMQRPYVMNYGYSLIIYLLVQNWPARTGPKHRLAPSRVLLPDQA